MGYSTFDSFRTASYQHQSGHHPSPRRLDSGSDSGREGSTYPSSKRGYSVDNTPQPTIPVSNLTNNSPLEPPTTEPRRKRPKVNPTLRLPSEPTSTTTTAALTTSLTPTTPTSASKKRLETLPTCCTSCETPLGKILIHNPQNLAASTTLQARIICTTCQHSGKASTGTSSSSSSSSSTTVGAGGANGGELPVLYKPWKKAARKKNRKPVPPTMLAPNTVESTTSSLAASQAAGEEGSGPPSSLQKVLQRTLVWFTSKAAPKKNADEAACVLCKKLKGYGCVVSEHYSSSVRAKGEGGEALEEGEEVEESQFRTGKYRPKQLFPPAKRTCALSHIRLGNAKTKEAMYEVLKCPGDIGLGALEKWLETKRKLFEDCLYSVAAVPEVMESASYLSTFDDVQNYINGRFDTTKTFVRKIITECLTYGDKRPTLSSTNSAQGASTQLVPSSASPIPPTRKSNIRAYLVIAHLPKTKPASSSTSTSKPSSTTSPSNQTSHPKYQDCLTAGFAVATFHYPTASLVLHDLVLRVPTMQQGCMEGEMLGAVVNRIESDMATAKTPKGVVVAGQPGETLEGGEATGSICGEVNAEMDSLLTASPTSSNDTHFLSNGSSESNVPPRPPQTIWFVMESAFMKWRNQMHRTGFTDVPQICVTQKDFSVPNYDKQSHDKSDQVSKVSTASVSKELGKEFHFQAVDLLLCVREEGLGMCVDVRDLKALNEKRRENDKKKGS
ncbi:hypothetical protein HDV05_006594 [Chytridiales sp. JEL 0842]|nr:hypothetical protein HDV05_006594 [Chytridiales sp. JEL 0842]